jgi:hypothetical protein
MANDPISDLLVGLGLFDSTAEVDRHRRRHQADVREAAARHAAWGEWRELPVKPRPAGPRPQETARQWQRRVSHTPAPRTAPSGRGFRLYQNREYTVAVAEVDTRHHYFGVVTYLMIARRDGRAVRSWIDLQRIKDTLVGAEYPAVEVYPPRSRVMDTANAYHLWVLKQRRCDFPLDLTTMHGFQDRAAAATR